VIEWEVGVHLVGWKGGRSLVSGCVVENVFGATKSSNWVPAKPGKRN